MAPSCPAPGTIHWRSCHASSYHFFLLGKWKVSNSLQGTLWFRLFPCFLQPQVGLASTYAQQRRPLCMRHTHLHSYWVKGKQWTVKVSSSVDTAGIWKCHVVINGTLPSFTHGLTSQGKYLTLPFIAENPVVTTWWHKEKEGTSESLSGTGISLKRITSYKTAGMHLTQCCIFWSNLSAADDGSLAGVLWTMNNTLWPVVHFWLISKEDTWLVLIYNALQVQDVGQIQASSSCWMPLHL